MRKLLLGLLLVPFLTNAQTPGQWTWMKGSGSVTASTPVYGTQGVAAAANTPGSLYESCEWTDKQGDFWIFGGLDPLANEMGDLWKFDPVTTNWTWVNGPGMPNQAGVYGTEGIPNAANQPGGRAYGMVTWLDNNGIFWMFGGYGYDASGGYGYLNDLWSYDMTGNQWTWVSGSNTVGSAGRYGTKGVPGLANVPPAKCEIATGWTDASGNLWIFGGFNPLYYNDLWKYNTASNEWTWMRGDSTSSGLGNYGTMGVANPANDPPSRYIYAHWKDLFGNFWMFGGTATTYGQMNDTWKYDPITNEWTWENGPNTGIDTGVMGLPCVADASYRPASRYENRASWTDACGNFYNFGGYHVTGIFSMSTIDDLWQYNPVTNEWKFINGGPDGSLGNFGTLGVSVATNMPPSLCGSNSFTDVKGNFWLFGGTNNGPPEAVNSVWRFVPDSTCNGICTAVMSPVASFQASDTNVCVNDCISFNNLSVNATSYQWTFTGAVPATSTDVNPIFVCYTSAGIFNVKLVAHNSGKSDSLTISSYINVKPAPPAPVISISGNVLYCSTDTSYKNYQWYDSTTIIPGATDTLLVISHSGNYNIQVTNKNGCSVAVGINIILGLYSPDNGMAFTISPNPAMRELIVKGDLKFENVVLSVFNALGEKMFSVQMQNRTEPLSINIQNLSAGLYFVNLQNDKGKWVGRFVKE